MEFEPTHDCSGVAFVLPVGGSLELGRKPELRLTHPRISRRHCSIQWQQAGDGSAAVLCRAEKRVDVQRAGSSSTTAVQAGEQVQLLAGDTLFLVREGGQPRSGFKLRPIAATAGNSSTLTGPPGRKTPADAAGSSHVVAPTTPRKRRGSDGSDTGAATAEGATAATSKHKHKRSRAEGGSTPPPPPPPPSAARVAAAGTASPTALPSQKPNQQPQQQQQQQRAVQGEVQQIFAGVRLVVWEQQHAHQAIRRAVEAGAELQDSLTATTTHVIAQAAMSPQEVQQRLQAEAAQQQPPQQPPHQQPQPQSVNQHAPAMSMPLPLPSSSAAAPTLRALPSPTSAASAALAAANAAAAEQQQQQHRSVARQLQWSGSLPQRPHRPQQQQQQQVKCKEAAQPSNAVDAGQPTAAELLLPPGVTFVTLHWITASLAACKRLPETLFLCQLQAPCTPAAGTAPRRTSSWRQQQPAAAAAAAAASITPAAAAAAQQQQPLSSILYANSTQRTMSAALGGQQQEVDSKRQQQQRPPGWLPRDEFNRQIEARVQADVQQLLQHQARQLNGFVLPSPDQVCRPGGTWGAGGRWIEHWDEAAARGTLEQLLRHWHRLRMRRVAIAKHVAARLSAAAAAGAGDPDATTSGDEGDEPTSAPATNTTCEHIACLRSSVCFVAEMAAVRDAYSSREVDTFKIATANRAIRALERLPRPLVSSRDVEALALGPKTTDKLKELLTTSKLSRTRWLAGCERTAVLRLFQSVRDAAAVTAECWFDQGCRTLDDVRRIMADSLTEGQRIGLKYHQDFLQRMPRREVAEAEAILQHVTRESLLYLGGQGQPDVTEGLHARCLGSYVRGAPDCGDIDFFISPGPAADDVGLGLLLVAILDRLTAAGHITEDMLPLSAERSQRGPGRRVCWKGVWKGPSSPCFRKLDIKLYPCSELALGVHYTSSGKSMSRALRFWCARPPPHVAALAAALNPLGNAFRLGDKELVVINVAYENTQQQSGARGPAVTGTARLPSGNGARAAGAGPSAAAAAAAAPAPAGQPAGGSADEAEELAGEEADAEQAELQKAPETEATTKLGDVREKGVGRRLVRETVVGPAIVVRCETDVFRALGLAYVPPHLRQLMVDAL